MKQNKNTNQNIRCKYCNKILGSATQGCGCKKSKKIKWKTKKH